MVGVVSGVGGDKVGNEVGDVFDELVEDVAGDEISDKISPSQLVGCCELDDTGGGVLVVAGMVGTNTDPIPADGT